MFQNILENVFIDYSAFSINKNQNSNINLKYDVKNEVNFYLSFQSYIFGVHEIIN